MEQCGDDEEFLQELLGDLKGEIDTQIVKMDGVLEVSCILCIGVVIVLMPLLVLCSCSVGLDGEGKVFIATIFIIICLYIDLSQGLEVIGPT